MYKNDRLEEILKSFSTVHSTSLVTMEWNMNFPDNIQLLGNYRYRPLETSSLYKNVVNVFDVNDSGNFYTGATDADITIDGGYDNEDNKIFFPSARDKFKQIYSLESCFEKFRPRSGINKLGYFQGRYLHHSNSYLAQRPRYYLADKTDPFKYWTSYRTEVINNSTIERGIAKNIYNGQYYIDDACPFVVYVNKIPTNRIVLKMQTHTGTKDLGPFSTTSGLLSDPLYGISNRRVPLKWRVQKLNNQTWEDIIVFDQNSKRYDGSEVIKEDGYVEITYGLIVPQEYSGAFFHADTFISDIELPDESFIGFAYLVKNSESDIGKFYVWTENGYKTFIPQYGWQLHEESVSNETNFVTDFVNPDSFVNTQTSETKYKEFEYISGIRVVVETMTKFDSTFDLIEISPRLVSDISDKVLDFSIKKTASDIGGSGLPVGQLLASTGSISMTDYDQAFNENNSSSIISEYVGRQIKFKFYEVVNGYDGYNYYIPLKTLYSDSVPKSNIQDRVIDIELRDFYYYLESMSAPSLFMQNISLTSAISTLLDYIGISNYSFKKILNEDELVLPFFFCSPDKNVAEVLNDLAISSQTAMFFDEDNNFILMSLGYMMPKSTERDVDFTLVGTIDQEKPFDIENINKISSIDNKVYNDGKLTYTTRYIQKSYGSLEQAYKLDQDKNWVYKPALLWEVSGTENTKSINDSAGTMSSYVLGAMPLNSDLSSSLPSVVNGEIINNVLDLGENVYWLTRYNGYFYSNGEIIKYDAAQFNVSKIGNVWISSVQEYQKYFAALPFNGKIYPTGLVRIYSEPDYEIVNGITKYKNGVIVKNGRGQFNTTITSHHAGIDSYWSSDDNVRGCNMFSEYIFNAKTPDKTTVDGQAGVSNQIAKQMTRTGIIKNFMTSSYISEYDDSKKISTKSGSVQSSALVLTGPTFSTSQAPIDYINYVHKPMTNKYKHFGTRFRIIGKVENNEVRGQTPVGSMTYYVVPGSDPAQNISVGGGSGGLGILVNPSTNVGYYFELAALTDTNINSYAGGSNLANMFFYKIKKDSASEKAVPINLWSGVGTILVDDGNFTGQYRVSGEANPTVYDVAVEYINIGSIRRFYLYVNNNIVAVVDDTEPLNEYESMCLFSRGSSKVMFENIFALTDNYSQNTAYSLDTPFNQIFDNQEINSNDAFRKYAMSSIIQSTYLSGISPSQPPSYSLYFDEFGSIMRECEYMNIKYDKAYPALYAKISPTFNKIKGYTVSGFQANPYGAEFLIFNATDSALSLDETSGNYLRIQGVTFTQESTHTLSVDDYFSEKTNPLNQTIQNNQIISSPSVSINKYDEIKKSRMKYGKNEFNLELPYIQTQDQAKYLMDKIINTVIAPRKSVGLEIFSLPILQLGDIVNIHYKDDSGLDTISTPETRYVIYNIEYKRDSNGPSMSIYLSEVNNG